MARINTAIAAISTPAGVGGIAVIRISGDDAQIIADKVFKSKKKISQIDGYTALLGKVFASDGKLIDECIALNFIAPRSFTGENVVELSCHGGTYTAKKVLEAVIQAGAKIATQGEFTKRAFLNGKMDLAQAESVIELIHATGERTREAAMNVKEGLLSKKIEIILNKLVNIGGNLSAWADYPDDDVPQIDEVKLNSELKEIEKDLQNLIDNFDMGKIYREGVQTVIAGRPNAGKSTLMNLLSGCERSIVTHIAGTTRDVVEESVILGDIPLVLADTAGLRNTDDPVEQIGVKLARERISSAELVLAVFDASQELCDEDKELIEIACTRPSVAIINKSDLDKKINLEYIQSKFEYSLYISALSGEGTAELAKMIEKLLGTNKIVAGSAEICTQRQREAVFCALTACKEAIFALQSGLTLDAVTVMTEDAVFNLLELKGEKVSEALVNNVFERFCVGK